MVIVHVDAWTDDGVIEISDGKGWDVDASGILTVLDGQTPLASFHAWDWVEKVI